jgi:thiamine-phosphate pyrophosphorylase
LIDFKLYLITDRKLFSDQPSLFTAVEDALKSGIKAVQLREKDLPIRELLDMAYDLRELTARYDTKLFINDRVDVALSVYADGVHLGRSSMPSYAAQKAAGKGIVIGESAHSIEEAKQAEVDGADFVTLGPVYETPSKLKYGKPLGLDILKKAKDMLSIPVFAIGGITLPRVDEVLKSGAYGMAIISAILTSHDIRTSTEGFMRLLK